MQFPDYYQILGVARGETPDNLKKAYRKLARRYHPDVSNESDADLRMKEVNEAYAVLSDPDKRAEYDALRDAAARGFRRETSFHDENAGHARSFSDIGDGEHVSHFHRGEGDSSSDFSHFGNMDDLLRQFFADFDTEAAFDPRG
ncbi:MAG: DnaJ domain-containing protein [Burkholderiaceae bacterium]|nr:DnaJ domain-containing protein [Burkholderiaceae bacterium]